MIKIKREDVIVDPTDPRTEELKGKKVVFGDNFTEIQEQYFVHILKDIYKKSALPFIFQDICSSIGFSMIAPLPEPTYKPYEEREPVMVGWELKRKVANDTWIIVGKSVNSKMVYLRHLSTSLVVCFELKYVSENFTHLDGTPFGIRED